MVHRYLHVANGTSVTMTLEAGGVPGLRSIWADPLYEGPVPAGLSDEQLRDVRAGFLGGGAVGDPMNDMRRWRDIITDRGSHDELVLWFEHDLFDQLNLIQLLSWIRSHPIPGRTVSLICIGSFPGRATFKGLGELTAAELASLFDTRKSVSDAEYSLAERAWRNFREPAPEALDELRRSDVSGLPFLAAALERFLQEYPWTKDGLSRTERRLLQLAEHGPMVMNAVFPRMHEGETTYYITDLSLAALVETLSRTSPPLLAFASDGTGDNFWKGSVTLTEGGREVLATSRDRVACGLDKWLGGVHLRSGDADWRWDETRRRIVFY